MNMNMNQMLYYMQKPISRLGVSLSNWLLYFIDWNNPYKHLGCYVDSGSDRTMDSFESWTLLSDGYQSRSDPITKCFYATKLDNYKVKVWLEPRQCWTAVF